MSLQAGLLLAFALEAMDHGKHRSLLDEVFQLTFLCLLSVYIYIYTLFYSYFGAEKHGKSGRKYVFGLAKR